MKKSNKNAFTIIELVIVIAVIAILAAVLIPTFSNLIEKANQSSDEQAVTNMNKLLKVEEGLNGTPSDIFKVKDIFDDNNFNSKFTTLSKEYEIGWLKNNNVIVLFNSTKILFPKQYTENTFTLNVDLIPLHVAPVKTSQQFLSVFNSINNSANVNTWHTIKIEEDIILSNSINLTEEVNIEIDLNGNSISTSSNNLFVTNNNTYTKIENGTLISTNDVPNGSVIFVYNNNSNLEINNCKLISSGNNRYCITTNGLETYMPNVVLNNCVMEGVRPDLVPIYISAPGNYTFNNCIVKGHTMIAAGNVVINGGEYISKSVGYAPNTTYKFNYDQDSKGLVYTEGQYAEYGGVYDYYAAMPSGSGDVGDVIAILDRRGSGYNLNGVTIKNAKISFENNPQHILYGIRYIDLNRKAVDPIVPIIENNVYDITYDISDPILKAIIDSPNFNKGYHVNNNGSLNP